RAPSGFAPRRTASRGRSRLCRRGRGGRSASHPSPEPRARRGGRAACRPPAPCASIETRSQKSRRPPRATRAAAFRRAGPSLGLRFPESVRGFAKARVLSLTLLRRHRRPLLFFVFLRVLGLDRPHHPFGGRDA